MFNRAKYYNELYSVDASILPQDSDILDVPSPVNDEENEQLFPQDPSTGQLADLLSQVLQTENPLLRDSLMSKLETLPSNSSALEQRSTVRERRKHNQQNLPFQKETGMNEVSATES